MNVFVFSLHFPQQIIIWMSLKEKENKKWDALRQCLELATKAKERKTKRKHIQKITEA